MKKAIMLNGMPINTEIPWPKSEKEIMDDIMSNMMNYNTDCYPPLSAWIVFRGVTR